MEFRQRLGSGGFADVFEGMYHGKPVAIKKMKMTTKNPAATREAFEAEACVLDLQHTHIIHLITASRHPDKVIIMELIPQAQTLQTLINDEVLYDWRDFARQLSSALSYLHQHDVLHLDLKPANIIVNPDHQCKVIDFGCSQQRSNPTMSACQGAPAYRAPELFRGQLPTTKSDVYSLAMTLWCLKHQQLPYDGQNNDMVIYQVVAFSRRPSPDKEFETLWHPDPERRPEAQDVTF